jgi:hypothetical protein
LVICGNCCYSQQQPKRQNTNLLLPITELSSFPIHGIEHCRQIADRLQTDCRQIVDRLQTSYTHTQRWAIVIAADTLSSSPGLSSRGCSLDFARAPPQRQLLLRLLPPGLDGDGRCRKVFHRCFHNGLRRMAFRAQVTNAEGTRATASRRFPP